MADKEAAQTSVYLNTEDREVLEKLQKRTGLPRSGVIRLALHRLYAEEQDETDVERMAQIRAAAETIVTLTQR